VRCKDLESFVRDLEAFMLDKGHHASSEVKDVDPMVDAYRRRFEEIMGHGKEGVEDGMLTSKRGGLLGRKEKLNDSPV